MVGKEHATAGIGNKTNDKKKGGVNMTTDAELDRMYEAAVADDWEEKTRTSREMYPEWDEAVKRLKTAQALLSEAVDVLTGAAEMVADSTDDDRILSISDEIRFLGKDLEKQAERMTA